MRSVHQTKCKGSFVSPRLLFLSALMSIMLLVLEEVTINEESTDNRGNRFCRESSG